MLSWILTFLLTYCLYYLVSGPADLPPGPFNLPIVGYLPFLKPPTYDRLLQLRKKYGDIFSLKFGSSRIVVLSSLDVIRKAFKQDNFSGRPDFPFLLLRSENKKGISFAEGKNWNEMRRFTLRTLRDFGFGKSSLENVIQAEIEELIEKLKNEAGRPMQLNNRFNLAVINALWTITTDERIQQDDEHVKNLLRNLTKMLRSLSSTNLVHFLPYLAYVPPFKSILQDQNRDVDKVKSIMLETIQKHRKNQSTAGESDFPHTFLKKRHNSSDIHSPFHENQAERQLSLVRTRFRKAHANLRHVAHDPEKWERPQEFYPEHFLTSDGKLRNVDAFIPFSTGKRVCLGETLARTELFLFTTALLKNFTFTFPSDRPKPSLKPTGGFVVCPEPYDVILTVR